MNLSEALMTTVIDTCVGVYAPKRYRQQQVKDLSGSVYVAAIERDSNPRPSGRKASTLPMCYHAPLRLLLHSVRYAMQSVLVVMNPLISTSCVACFVTLKPGCPAVECAMHASNETLKFYSILLVIFDSFLMLFGISL